MKNNGKVRDVRILACKIKVLNGRVPGTWKWTIVLHDKSYCQNGLTGQYVGCYEDRKTRIMESKKFVDKKNTIGNCIRRCIKMGRKYAGVEVRFYSKDTL